MDRNTICPGTTVAFDSDAGPQTGTVHEIEAGISNGSKIAVIRVAGTLDGAPWRVLVSELTHKEAA